jgi:hypothetical protein
MKHLILATLLLAAPAHAACVIFDGDSITAASTTLYGTNGEWPKLLQAQRPDVVPCNIAAGGKNTTQALSQFDNTVNWLKLYHVITDGVLLIGVNNMIAGKTVAQTAADIRTWCDKAIAQGIEPHVMTLTPATNFVYANTYVGNVSTELLCDPGDCNVYNLRDKYTAIDWVGCSDNIHPTGLACRQVIADFVAGWLPAQ